MERSPDEDARVEMVTGALVDELLGVAEPAVLADLEEADRVDPHGRDARGETYDRVSETRLSGSGQFFFDVRL